EVEAQHRLVAPAGDRAEPGLQHRPVVLVLAGDDVGDREVEPLHRAREARVGAAGLVPRFRREGQEAAERGVGAGRGGRELHPAVGRRGGGGRGEHEAGTQEDGAGAPRRPVHQPRSARRRGPVPAASGTSVTVRSPVASAWTPAATTTRSAPLVRTATARAPGERSSQSAAVPSQGAVPATHASLSSRASGPLTGAPARRTTLSRAPRSASAGSRSSQESTVRSPVASGASPRSTVPDARGASGTGAGRGLSGHPPHSGSAPRSSRACRVTSAVLYPPLCCSTATTRPLVSRGLSSGGNWRTRGSATTVRALCRASSR